ncbi:Bug family tripartite tricarboxylate transporter substrate binding protein [Thalassospira xiamenensis]|uniref:Tricarboxylic transport membrane protein n=1 Tax=Thalassospira xiamenensis TaxID=220697 RepID=A0ABR5Y6S5_9PROT|nr:tripartite tricarboxylate transporter substrate binding protein [Thalassospira xiamenensis]KZD06162.1 hypothetical protein AUP40_11195 [Thalassospira xiamenensis]KZD07550.1 hypothetical protein AUP45_03945 [Thalassospira xiamenensis]
MLKKCLTTATVMLALGGAAHAQDYPVDPVLLVTHSSPGAGGDVFLRELAKAIAPELGVNVIVENVSGGSGATAMAYMAEAPKDGSVFYGTTPTFIYTSLLSNPEYSYKDLDPLVNVFEDPEVIFTSTKGSIKTLEDAMNKARESRGTWGASNPSSLERQSLELLKSVSGVNAAIVTHEGGGDMLINVLNGTLDIGVGEMQELRAQIEAGEVIPLAILGKKRLPGYPDVPTATELGYDVVVRKFRGIAAPKGLPEDIAAKWEAAVSDALERPDFKEWYENNSLKPDFMPQSEYRAFINSFAEDTGAFLRSVGVIE